MTRLPKRKDMADAASKLRQVLSSFPKGRDTPADRVVRRRIEGAIAATELATGEPAPRQDEASLHDKGLHDTDD